MFNLEQSIAEWRKQMLAAGIKSPVPLEELESHLREEIEEQIESGLSEQQAFEATVLQIGQGQELQTEFAKERGWRELLQGNMSKRAKGVLLCCVVSCLIAFRRLYHSYPHPWLTSTLLIISLAIIAMAAYLAGTLWSLFLFRSTKQVRSVVNVIAHVGTFLLLVPMFILTKSPIYDILFSSVCFNSFTIVLLQPRPPAEPKNATQ